MYEDILILSKKLLKEQPHLTEHILNNKFRNTLSTEATLKTKTEKKKRTLQVHRKNVNLGNVAGVNTKGVTTSEIIEKIINLDKARTGLFSKDKGMTALDFDDTVAKTKSKVIVNTPQNLEGLSKFDKMLQREFDKSPHTRHLRVNEPFNFWEPGFLKTSKNYFERFVGDFDMTNIQVKFEDLYVRRKKIKDLDINNTASELRAKLKKAKGENKENIELALQEKFKKLPGAV